MVFSLRQGQARNNQEAKGLDLDREANARSSRPDLPLLQVLSHLRYDQEPDYAYLRNLVKDIVLKRGGELEYRFDWVYKKLGRKLDAKEYNFKHILYLRDDLAGAAVVMSSTSRPAMVKVSASCWVVMGGLQNSRNHDSENCIQNTQTQKIRTGGLGLFELFQKAQIAVKEQAQIVHAVAQHGQSVWTHAKSKSNEMLWI